MKTVIELIEANGLTLHGDIEHFAELARADAIAAEREACAKVCEELLGPTATDFYGKTYAAAIRARSNT
ncbi:MAG: hypothetical protein ACOVN5_04680 [Aquidulcibacter sp.]|jgi:hypothetical protein